MPEAAFATLQAQLLPDAPASVWAEALTVLAPLTQPFAQAPDRLGLERSFKLTRSGVLAQRFLVAVRRQHVPEDTLLALPHEVSMPAPLQALYLRRLPQANFLYLGFDHEAGQSVFKVYLEFPVRLRAHEGGPLLREPGVQALGFKWSPQRPERHVVTRYVLHPGLSLVEMHDRLPQQAVLADAAAVLAQGLTLAQGRAPDEAFDCLSVSEPGLPRASVDVNLYPANLRVSAMAPALQAFLRGTGASDTSCSGLGAHLQAVGASHLGHLSMGLGRDAQAFVTVYHRL